MRSRFFFVSLLSLCHLEVVLGFNTIVAASFRSVSHSISLSSSQLQSDASDLERPSTFLDGDNNKEQGPHAATDINVVFMNDVDDDEDDGYDDGDDNNMDMVSGEGSPEGRPKGRNWFENISPKHKKRLREEGQAKAIANKKKRESSQDKRRRLMMFVKEKQKEKKLASRVNRPLGFNERAPLTAFSPGMEVTGVVISLTNYGAYVDVGTECDGLLHISQITRDFFVEHPRQVLSPGDEITVKVRSTSAELKKMHLTMLDSTSEDSMPREDDEKDRIPLSEIETDDELWGELKRVTDFGAYVEVGAEVDGFLHFMDHPLWDDGAVPSQFMKKGERVRVWVADVDMEKRRVRLTGKRPQGLPGPRLEL